MSPLPIRAGSPYAILHRPGSGRGDQVEIVSGPVRTAERLADLTLDDGSWEGRGRHTKLVLLPYRQLAERGYDCPDDQVPLQVMDIEAQTTLTVAEILAALPDGVPPLEDRAFDLGDDEYARTVERILDDEIGAGEGANFVLSRSLRGRFPGFDDDVARAVFKRLLGAEAGAYWTFLVFTGERYLLGSTPEQHVRLFDRTVTMNPISGTYRYPEGGADAEGLLEFLHDEKEADELCMVVDEELKMMAELCDRGIRVSGPRLRRMSRLAHTEYSLEGETGRPLTEVLRHTLLAPTVTGSPLVNACRVIRRYEPKGRGYYSGVIGLVGSDDDGRRSLDSAILIRTADISPGGDVRLAAGSTIVRESAPLSEAAETTAKVSAVLKSLAGETRATTASPPPSTSSDEVRSALKARNDGKSRFWLDGARPGTGSRVRITVVDAEDAFTSMLAYQLKSVNCDVTTVPWDAGELPDNDLVLLGPGPGDPNDVGGAKVGRLRALAADLLRAGRPLVGVCLGHQVLCAELGLPVQRLARPNQGRQAHVTIDGTRRAVGFYNSFAARTADDRVAVPGRAPADVVRGLDDQVIGLRGPGLATIQFHAESFLTEDGPAILRDVVDHATEGGSS